MQREMISFIRHLFWQKEWIPIAGGMLFGLVFGIYEEANAYQLYEGEPRWQSYHAEIDASCPEQVINAVVDGMKAYENFYPTSWEVKHTTRGSTRDAINTIFCDGDFSEVSSARAVESYRAVDNSILGRAYLWWQDGYFVEADIQLKPEIGGWAVRAVVEHELGHVSGCAHSAVSSALMYPTLLSERSFLYDDLQCLNELYPFSFSALDYRGNLFVPDAREIGKRQGWGILKRFVIEQYGVKNDY